MKRFIIYFSSILLLLCGIALLVVGSLGHVWLNELTAILSIFPYMPAFFSLVIGSVMIILGAIMIVKPDNLKLSFYVGIIAVILMAAIGITTIFLRDNTVHNAQTGFRDLFRARFFSAPTLNGIQQNFQCCGKTGPQNFNPDPIPASCCLTNTLPCTNPFTLSCNRAFYDHIGLISAMIGWTTIGLAGLVALTGLVLLLVNYKSKN